MIATILLIAYLLVLFCLTMEPISSPPEYRLKLLPFGSITEILLAGGWEMVVNIPGNLAVFFPLGFLLPLLGKIRLSSTRIALVSGLVSLLIEVLQYFSRRRIADVDDILLNTAGGLLGYLAFLGMRRVVSAIASGSPTRK
jgi:glycopeptide antibiotics resistance protein